MSIPSEPNLAVSATTSEGLIDPDNVSNENVCLVAVYGSPLLTSFHLSEGPGICIAQIATRQSVNGIPAQGSSFS